MTSLNTQLTKATDYDVSLMRFSEPIQSSIPDTTISYKRINITTINNDGTEGELLIPTERLFSFGVSENTDPKTKEVNGWTMPHCLHSKDGSTTAEREWVKTFNGIVNACVGHLVENSASIDKYDLDRSDLKGFNPLYYKTTFQILRCLTDVAVPLPN